MIGLVLALIVVAIILSLVGLWIFAIPIGVVAVVLLGRRATTRSPDASA
jgi:predicted membrane protein